MSDILLSPTLRLVFILLLLLWPFQLSDRVLLLRITGVFLRLLSPFARAFLDLPAAGSGSPSCSEHLLTVQAGCRTAFFGASFTASAEIMCFD